jgi:hypothetical protein
MTSRMAVLSFFSPVDCPERLYQLALDLLGEDRLRAIISFDIRVVASHPNLSFQRSR